MNFLTKTTLVFEFNESLFVTKIKSYPKADYIHVCYAVDNDPTYAIRLATFVGKKDDKGQYDVNSLE
jgi:hypothetical protein